LLTSLDIRSLVRYRDQSGQQMLNASLSGFDPKRSCVLQKFCSANYRLSPIPDGDDYKSFSFLRSPNLRR
jgi:hypothetical protein